MKTLTPCQLEQVSAGTFDQVLGRGFTFGAAVGLITGGLVTYINGSKGWSNLIMGAGLGACIGGFSGALVTYPLSTYFNQEFDGGM